MLFLYSNGKEVDFITNLLQLKITLFHKEKYHLLRLTLNGVEAVSEKFTDPAEAEQAAAACKGAVTTCTSVTKEKKKEQPPKLYDLTTLQREANRLFGYTAKQTLDYAQSLYEKKLLTYPRTDSRYLTSDMAETASCVIHLAAKVPPFDGISNFFPLVEAMISDNIDYFVFEPNIHDLNDLGWRYLAQHMDTPLPPELLKAIDPVPFGKYAMQEEQGHFTELLSDPLAQLAFLSHDLWIEISLHRQAADFYKLYDDRQAGDRALVFNVGKIPGINIHLFG